MIMEMEENLKQSIKYIVYITVNKINKKIYIGVHKVIGDRWDFYIGDGVYTNKPSSYKKSKTLFQRAVNKYGVDAFVRITLYEFKTEIEALKKEEEIVNEAFLKRKDVYNMVLGGSRPPKQKEVPIHQYDLEGNYLKSYDSIQEAAFLNKIKYSTIGHSVKVNHACHGYLWSYDKVDKLTWTKYNKPRKVAVYKDGKLIKIYNTVRECKKDYCGCVHVLSGARQKCKGCTFKYID